MRSSLLLMLLLSGTLLSLMAGAWEGLRQWYESISILKQYVYMVIAVCFAALVLSRFDVVSAGIMVAGAMYMAFIGFLIWVASKL